MDFQCALYQRKNVLWPLETGQEAGSVITTRSVQAEDEIKKYTEVVKSMNFRVVKLSFKLDLLIFQLCSLEQKVNLIFLFH